MSSYATSLVTIETLLLSRYAEAAPDGTLTLVGAGLNTMLRAPSADVQLWLAGTLLIDGSPGLHAAHLVYRLRDPDGDLAAEASIGLEATISTRTRVPFVIPVPLPSRAPDGSWELSVSGRDDFKMVSLEVLTSYHDEE